MAGCLCCRARRRGRTGDKLDDETVAALEAHREAQLAERAFAGAGYSDRDLIFCDELGGTINPQRLTERFGALRKAAGIRPGRLHDVRHSHAAPY